MKKLFAAAVALICITMAGVAFTACGSDDNETFEPPFQTRTLSAAEVCYIVHMPYNGRNICDYIVTYTEAELHHEHLFRRHEGGYLQGSFSLVLLHWWEMQDWEGWGVYLRTSFEAQHPENEIHGTLDWRQDPVFPKSSEISPAFSSMKWVIFEVSQFWDIFFRQWDIRLAGGLYFCTVKT